jgi:hypothetical protein
VALRFPLHQAAPLVVTLLVCLTAEASSQSITVHPTGEHLQIRTTRFAFLSGETVDRLKDGRSVRAELTLLVLPAPGKSALVTVRRIFGLSYDLWEERFAVTTVDTPRQTISHLTAAAAQAWCIDRMSVPLSSLGSLRAADAAFWVRLEHRVLNAADGHATEDSTFTLQGLIDVLSRRRRAESEGDAIEGGPFRLSLLRR